jgi:uncharacterized protein YfaS (alpha-2-macroglobulin family)
VALRPLSLLCLAVVVGCEKPASPPPPTPVSPPATREAAPIQPPESLASVPPEPAAAPAPRVQSATLGGCDGAGCPIVINLSETIDKLPKLTLTPALKGFWKLSDGTQLIFTPERPLATGESVVVSAKQIAAADDDVTPLVDWHETLTVGQRYVANKIVDWPELTGMPRLVTPLTVGTRFGPNGLFLVFDQPVTPSALKSKITVRVDGKPVRFTLDAPASAGALYNAPLEMDHVVRIGVPRLEDGARVEVGLPSWDFIDSNVPKLVVDARTFEFVGRVRVLSEPSFGKDERVPLSTSLVTRFENLVTDEDVFTVSPAPKSQSTNLEGYELMLSLELEPGQRYIVTRGKVTDLFGNVAPAKVFKLRAQDLEPQLQLPSVAVAIERGAPRLPIRALNVEKIEASVTRVASVEEFVAVAPGVCSGTTVGTSKAKAKLALNEYGLVDLPLERMSGLLCVNVTAEGRGSEATGRSASTRVQISDLAATVKTEPGGYFVWATKLSDASPVRGAKVQLHDGRGKVVATATADNSGVARLKGSGRYVSVQEKGDLALTDLDEPNLSSAWQFGLKGPGAQPQLDAAVFTERGVYRPGETVHVKLIAPGAGLALKVTDPRGQKVIEKSLKPDALGGANFDVALNEKAATGSYTIALTRNGTALSRRFLVEEYRVPNFEVKTALDEKGVATIEGRYLHGGAMPGREAKWELNAEPEPFAPAGFSGFTFQGLERGRGNLVKSETQKLDGNGRLELELPLQHDGRGGPTRFTLEATVTDVDRQAWASRASKVVHPSSFYVGVRPPAKAVLSENERVEVPIVAVTPEGKLRAGVEVEVSVTMVEHHQTARLVRSAGWPLSEVSDRAVKSPVTVCRVMSADKPVTCDLLLADAGSYEIFARAHDGAQNVAAGFGVTVAGSGPVAWPRFDKERIDVVADKPRYQVGDTAKLVVQTPFDSASALLTVENAGVVSHRLFNIEHNTPALEVPITAAMVPNAFVSVTLLRGRAHYGKDAAGYETGAPAFRLGYAKLSVDPATQRLSVAVKPSAKVAKPKDELDIELQVKDASGQPAPGALALAVVDEGVLGLTAFKTPEPVGELYAEKPLGVRTADGRLDLVTSRRDRQEMIFPGGDGDPGESMRKVLNGDLRSLFQSTAYWNPKVEVGADGVAHAKVKLPDNLTTFRVMAVAYDAKGRAGSSDAKLVVRKPLMLQAALPRFVYPGDAFDAEVNAFNGTAEPQTLDISVAELEGLSVRDGAPRLRNFVVKPGESVKLSVPVSVTGRGTARVRFAAKAANDADSVEVKLPILDAGAKRVTVATGQVTGNGELELDLPGERVPGSTELEMMVSTSSLSELQGAAEYLMGYPNGCIEQTTSTAYPLVMLKDLLPEMGVTVDEAKLKEYSEAGVKRLLSFQTTSGGLAYWPGSDQPHAFGTTFGLTALIEAKKRGYNVPDEALQRAAAYLEKSLREGNIVQEMPHAAMADADTRAVIVLTLNRLGRPQPAYVSTLWREKDKLTPFGLSMLAVTVSEGGGDHALLEPMLDAVRKAAVEEPKEAHYDGDRAQGWSMGSPLRTHAAALLAYGQPGVKSDLGGRLLSGFLHRQNGAGNWGNTQENVYGIMGIAKLAASGQGGQAPQLGMSLQGSPLKMDDFEKVTDHARRLTLHGDALKVPEREAARVTLAYKKQGGLPTFVNVRAKYEVELKGPAREAFSRGFEVTRRYETLDGQSLEGKTIPLGAVVRVHVAVKSDTPRHYVAVDDKLPAGLEPLNTNLATTEKASLGDATPAVTAGLSALSYSETRDARVAFYADELPAGSFEWVYLARATTPGHFIRPAAGAEAMYDPEVAGGTAVSEVDIKPATSAHGRRSAGTR